MLISPNTSASVLALHPKSFGEMSRGEVKRGNSMCDELFFCFYVTSITIELRQKCCHILNLSQALSFQTLSMSELLIGHMCVERPCGWQPYSSTLDYWLGHLVHCQMTWNRPLLVLNDVYHVWLSGYKCVTAHFHPGDLHAAVCCHISRCKLPILHSSFY